MANLIAAAVLMIIVGSASFYIWKEKKNGKKCIGCPMSGCSSNKNCTCHAFKADENSGLKSLEEYIWDR